MEVRSDGVIDAVETAAKMTEHFAAGRFTRRCEIVDADLRADNGTGREAQPRCELEHNKASSAKTR